MHYYIQWNRISFANDIRLQLVRFIECDGSMCLSISHGLDQGDSVENYLDRMKKTGTWEDGNILSAAAMC